MSNLFQLTLPAGAISVRTKAQGNESTQSWNGASSTEDQHQTKKIKTTFLSLYTHYLSSLIVVMESWLTLRPNIELINVCRSNSTWQQNMNSFQAQPFTKTDTILAATSLSKFKRIRVIQSTI